MHKCKYKPTRQTDSFKFPYISASFLKHFTTMNYSVFTVKLEHEECKSGCNKFVSIILGKNPTALNTDS